MKNILLFMLYWIPSLQDKREGISKKKKDSVVLYPKYSYSYISYLIPFLCNTMWKLCGVIFLSKIYYVVNNVIFSKIYMEK